MDENKYMTITAFSFHEGGRVKFSGLHLDILIYRALTGSVDEIETDGIWLGLSMIPGRNKSDYEFTINAGDVILLYTDGITESMKNGEMFGVDRLIDVLQLNGKKSPEVIRDSILDAIQDYKSHDDVTMVVLKRLE